MPRAVATSSGARRALLGVLALGVAATAGAADLVTPSLYVGAGYTGDFRRNTTGGLATGNAYSDSIDLGVEWTTAELFGTATLTTSLSIMHLGGDGISGEYVGDAQGINNIEAPPGWYLYESWFELSFGGAATSVRAGVLDLNAEFDTPVTSALFTQSSFGVGPELSQTGERGPGIWPVTGLGVRAAGALSSRWRWRLGAYDGAPGTNERTFTSLRVSDRDGALLIGELEYSNERIHKLAFGSWAYTAKFAPIDAELTAAPDARGNRGFYAVLDGAVGSLGRADFDAALRVGTANDRFNAFDHYVGVALTATHFWASRPEDSLGLGVARVGSGARYRALQGFLGQPATSGEISVELAYRTGLTDWLSVMPLVQYVRNPGMDAALQDAWIAGVRFEISREKSWPLSARLASPAHSEVARTESRP